jgi:hypothetical protein
LISISLSLIDKMTGENGIVAAHKKAVKFKEVLRTED